MNTTARQPCMVGGQGQDQPGLQEHFTFKLASCGPGIFSHMRDAYGSLAPRLHCPAFVALWKNSDRRCFSKVQKMLGSKRAAAVGSTCNIDCAQCSKQR